MREYTYVGTTVTIGMVDDRTADSAPSGRSCKRRCDVGRYPPLLHVIRLRGLM